MNMLATGSAPALRDLMPESLLRGGPLGLELWQWLVLPIVLVFAAVLGAVLARVAAAFAGRLAPRSTTLWDDDLVTQLLGPSRLLFAGAAAWVASPLLALADAPGAALLAAARGAAYGAFFWAAFRAVAVTATHVAASPGRRVGPARRPSCRSAHDSPAPSWSPRRELRCSAA